MKLSIAILTAIVAASVAQAQMRRTKEVAAKLLEPEPPK